MSAHYSDSSISDIQLAVGTNHDIVVTADENDASILKGIVHGFIHSNIDDPHNYAPRLLSNQNNDTMGEAIGAELQSCESFDITVAFVSAEAIRTLFENFKDRGISDNNQSFHSKIPSRIITSTKNFFNAPQAFWELLRLKNVAHIDVRIWGQSSANSNGESIQDQAFHPKGYIFARRMGNGTTYYNLYVGSSNLTQQALTTQREWNLKVSSLQEGELTKQFQQEIDDQISQSEPLTKSWIEQYEEDFKKYAPPRREILESIGNQQFTPNKMQCEALENLAQLRAHDEHRAIIISATGTGKTVLSALDVKAAGPKHMLYLAHRQEILKKAAETYEKVLGCQSDDIGLFFSGAEKQADRRYVFATVETIGKPETLRQFTSDAFDYILIDEAHHAAANSYQRIIDHFRDANFILGMTATPERTDGANIFELFGHNIAYEIRLQQALDENMLCPFHYYGVTEYLGSQSDGNNTDSKTIQVSPVMSTDDSQQVKYEISQLATPERVRYIIDVLRQYSPYHQQVTGLVFCSRTDEAQRLSDLFNSQLNQQAERNYRTKVLSGSTPHKEREKTIKELEHGDLDYIFTVDLFNEGIDIPAINQIVMLRNTQSSIVFTQQLGRGLRKFPHKESVTVIDFIGNYANNYLIPVALYGNTGDRDITRKNLQRHSIGLSSISFDPIAKERVLKSLDTADWSDMRKLTEQYRQLKFELGCTPMLADLYHHDYSLPYTIASKCGNYYDFVRSRERSLGQKNHNTETSASLSSYDNLPELSDNQSGILKLATEVLLPGLRPHELVILSLLCNFADAQMNPTDKDTIRSNDWRDAGSISLDCLSETVSRVFPERICKTDTDHQQFESALRVLDYSYFTSTNVKRFGNIPLIDVENGHAHLTQAFADLLRHDSTFRIFLQDTLRVGLLNCCDISNAARKSQRTFEHAFLYGQKYTLADVMRLLCWNKEGNGQNVGGYSVDYVTNTMPVFVKYATSQYEDQFLNQHDMRWFSKNGRTPNSPEFQWMGNGLDNDTWQDNHFIPLFVMRKEESKEARYYYVGHIIGFDQPKLRTKSDANNTKIVKVTSSILHLNKPLDAEMYRHLTGITII